MRTWLADFFDDVGDDADVGDFGVGGVVDDGGGCGGVGGGFGV